MQSPDPPLTSHAMVTEYLAWVLSVAQSPWKALPAHHHSSYVMSPIYEEPTVVHHKCVHGEVAVQLVWADGRVHSVPPSQP
jgi:hypothetical protein